QKVTARAGRLHPGAFVGPGPGPGRPRRPPLGEGAQDVARGGHDYRKLYAAYRSATEHTGSPTAILAKTIKGWTLGPEIEARNATHQIKKMNAAQLKLLRDRLYLEEEIPDAALEAGEPPFFRPAADSVEYEDMMSRRQALN